MTRRQWSLLSLEVMAAVGLLALAVWMAVARPQPPLVTGESFGYTPDPAGTRAFLSELEHPTFGEASDAVKKARGVDVFLYRMVDASHRKAYQGTPWKCWNQGAHGSCVSFAFALGSYTAQAVDAEAGKMPKAPLEVATEPVYGGSRTAARLPPIAVNNGGDGSYGGAAARWISGNCQQPGIGGILYRQVYGSVDLRSYSIPRSIEYGRTGVPLDLAKLANKHRAMAVAQVTSWEELCASLERGSPVVLCSTVGYGRYDNRMPVRDELGFLPRGKSWAHAMLCWGVRHAQNGGGRDGGLVQNSWSEKWCGGPKWPGDQPDGSFWAARADIQAALDQGDSFAIGGVTGLEWRELDHGIWVQPAPPEALTTGIFGLAF